MRVLRLAAALTMLASFAANGDTVALFGGVFFGYQAIFNVGCCGAQGCNVPYNETPAKSID